MRKDQEVRILASSPDYQEINLIQEKIALLKNRGAGRFGSQSRQAREMPEVERKASITEHEEYQRELLEFQNLPFNRLLRGK